MSEQPPSSNPSPQTKVKEVGGFELIGKVGQGGMGAVFKARQKSLDRIVALKLLPPSIAKDATFIERFQREARASARLNHPNIVQGIDVGKDSATGLWYFAMEYVDGPSVKKLLEQQKVLPEERALAIVREVASALVTVAAAQMVHRDIKPDNILLTLKGDSKLADLGLAKQTHDDASVTQSGQAIGTPFYMSPEQARGEADNIDIRTDIYALGATLFHMVTGHVPYEGPTSAVIMTKHLTDPVPKARKVNPAVSEGCSRLIERMMQKNVAQRVQTPTELLQQIDRVLQHRTEATSAQAAVRRSTGPVKPVTERSEESSGGSRSLIIAASIGVIAIVLLVVALRAKPQARPAETKDAETKVLAKGGNTVPVTKKSAEVPPQKVGSLIDEALRMAQEFDKKNPGAFKEIGERYQKALAVAKGTPSEQQVQDKVEDALAAVHTRQTTESDAAWKNIEQKVQTAVAANNYDAALAALQALPPNVAETLDERASAKARDLHQAAETRITEIRKKVEQCSTDAEPKAGLEALAEAEKIAYAPTKGIVEELKKRLTDELANEGELKKKKAAVAGLKKYADALQKFDDALLTARDIGAAQAIATAAKADEALTIVAPFVGAMCEIAAGIEAAAKYEQDAVAGLKGQNVELETTSGRTKKGTISKYQDGAITLEFEVSGGGGKASVKENVKLADLTDAARKKLMPPYTPNTPAQHVALAYTKLAKGTEDYAAALALLDGAKDFPLKGHAQDLANRIRKTKELAQAEAEAPGKWGEIQLRAAAPKLSESEAKILREKLAAFEQQCGATEYAKSIKEKLATLKTKLGQAAASGPNLVVNGGFETGTLEPWKMRDEETKFSFVAGYAGQNSIRLQVGAGGRVNLGQSIKVDPDVPYKFSIATKLVSGTPLRALVRIMGVAGGEARGGEPTKFITMFPSGATPEFQRVEAVITPVRATIEIDLFVNNKESRMPVICMLDDVEVARLSGAGTAGSAAAAPPMQIPDIYKQKGLVFWVNPTADPVHSTRELVSNVVSSDTGTVHVIPSDLIVKGMQFSSSCCNYPASEEAKAVSAGGTAIVWIKPEKINTTWHGLVTRCLKGATPATSHDDFSLWLDHGKFALRFNWPENTWPDQGKFASKANIPAGEWTMCAATWDGKNVTIYINGKRDSSHPAPEVPAKRGTLIALGANPPGTPEFYSGLIGAAMIWNQPLTEVELGLLNGTFWLGK
ncbi:MAG TPA: protein kinase [Planctomycetota bacterium]|jgi:serine/threonine protein kinase